MMRYCCLLAGAVFLGFIQLISTETCPASGIPGLPGMRVCVLEIHLLVFISLVHLVTYLGRFSWLSWQRWLGWTQRRERTPWYVKDRMSSVMRKKSTLVYCLLKSGNGYILEFPKMEFTGHMWIFFEIKVKMEFDQLPSATIHDYLAAGVSACVFLKQFQMFVRPNSIFMSEMWKDTDIVLLFCC